MAGEQIGIEILLPFIIRLFPQLVRAPIVGRIIPLFKVDPSTDADLARALQRDFKRKPDSRINDNVHVIKLSDAISCVEKTISDGKLQSAGVITLAKMLLDQRTGGSPIGDAIIACLRENVLRQDTVRSGSKVIKSPRPAKGHGHGRI
jgi:hypothetical protein